MIDVLIGLQGTILIYMFFGFILKKNNMINEQASMFLSRFILEFILPINIFNSCIQSFTIETLQSCIFILLIAIVIELVLYVFTRFTLHLFVFLTVIRIWQKLFHCLVRD